LAENLEAGENGGQSVSSKMMQTVTIEQIESKLKRLPEDKLAAVYHFVSYLADGELDMSEVSARELILASESLIAKEWDTPEEDQAWAHL
jgi:hypothetical protein